MTHYRFVLHITRSDPSAGPPVDVTYDSAAPGVSVTGNPHPAELKLIQKLVEVCECEVRGHPIRIVRAQE